MLSRSATNPGATLPALCLAAGAHAQQTNTNGPTPQTRFIPYQINLDDAGQLSTAPATNNARGNCPQIEANYTTFDFTSGARIVVSAKLSLWFA